MCQGSHPKTSASWKENEHPGQRDEIVAPDGKDWSAWTSSPRRHTDSAQIAADVEILTRRRGSP
jgi:hypothetical protein